MFRMQNIMLDICLVVYQRAPKVPEIIKQLNKQTNQDFNLNIWNNSIFPLDVSQFPKDRLKIIHSKTNRGSWSRFLLAKETYSNPIIFIDDDEELEPDFVEYYYQQWLKYGKDCILGGYTKRWQSGEYKNLISPVPVGQEADYVGTGGMILDREILRKENYFLDIEDKYKIVEDTYLCYVARMKYNMKLISIEPKLKQIDDRQNQSKKLKEYKGIIWKELREKGWKLLFEGIVR